MDPLEAASRAGFIPERSKEAFVAWLTKSGNQHAILPHPDEQRLQGDIYRQFPFALVKDDHQASIALKVILVLNNTCDLQLNRTPSCNVALAADYNCYAESIRAARSDQSATNFLADVERNRIDDLFFLQDCPTFPAGLVVFLNKISTVPTKLYERALKQGHRFASLSQHGFYHLLIKLNRFFARVETSDVSRLCAG